MKYNWQHPDWPHFVYEVNADDGYLYTYIKETASLKGAMDQLSDSSVMDTMIELMLEEALKTSEIEGELLSEDDVRSSLRLNLGVPSEEANSPDERAQGIAQLMIDVRRTFAEPLTKEQLWAWHTMVMKGHVVHKEGHDIGCWRSDEQAMQIVAGPLGREKVFFEAPPFNRVASEMESFITWFNQSMPTGHETSPIVSGPVRAAITHLYFESIHPFIDGNGRIGRALAEKALSQDLGAPVLLSLSHTIAKKRKDYYQKLHDYSGYSMNVTGWVHFFVDVVCEAQKTASAMIEFVLKKAKFWRAHADHVNIRQEKVLNRMFKEGPEGFIGGINAQKYMRITGCSKATATRDLSDLVSKGCLYQLPGAGPTTRYDIKFKERSWIH
jgi:Fic family protein